MEREAGPPENCACPRQLPQPLLGGLCVPETSKVKNCHPTPPHPTCPPPASLPFPKPNSLTSLCWDKFLESWDLTRSQTLSPEKSVRHLGFWGCWRHCHWGRRIKRSEAGGQEPALVHPWPQSELRLRGPVHRG
jgi:hypothetical protein